MGMQETHGEQRTTKEAKRRRLPDKYTPSASDMFFLVSESTRGRMIFGDIWEGRATAAELAAVLWPVDPNKVGSYPHLEHFAMNVVTPAQWVADVLDHEVKPCFLGGGGRFRKEGNDYIVDVLYQDTFRETNKLSAQAGGGRPYLLPRWPKN